MSSLQESEQVPVLQLQRDPSYQFQDSDRQAKKNVTTRRSRPKEFWHTQKLPAER